MKKLFNTHYLLFFVLFGLALTSGCGGDDPEPTAVTVQNFSATIAENPAQGTVLGTLSATTNRGTLAYALTAQNPAGAFALNATTGQITVADASVFDFEARTTVTATATATADGVSNTASITITLTDVQEITVTANNFGVTVNEHPTDGTVWEPFLPPPAKVALHLSW